MWAEIPILGRLVALGSVLAILGGVYALWHHNVYTQGYGACQIDRLRQQNKAQITINKIEDKYGIIKNNLKESKSFDAPASPLVSSAINRMPNHHNH